MLHVIATIEIEAGKRAEFLAIFTKWLTPLVLAEDGCIEYGAAIDTPTHSPMQVPLRPDVVTVVEKWANLDALNAHSKAPHMAEYRVKISGLVKKVALQIMEPV